MSRKSLAIGIFLVFIIVALLAFALVTGIIQFNVSIPSNPSVSPNQSVKNTTISRVMTEGMISVFEDQECTKPTQSIDWGKVESNQQYSHTVYVRNDNQEKWLDSGKRDIVWQRENVNPSSIYISIKINYGDTKLEPNEVRQAVITLTVLGLLEDSDKLDTNTNIPQFAFDLMLKVKTLTLLLLFMFIIMQIESLTISL